MPTHSRPQRPAHASPRAPPTSRSPRTTVRDALAALERRHPGIAAQVLDGSGAVKPFIRIFVGPDDIGGLSGLDTTLADARRDLDRPGDRRRQPCATSRSGATRATSCSPTSAGSARPRSWWRRAHVELRESEPHAELIAARVPRRRRRRHARHRRRDRRPARRDRRRTAPTPRSRPTARAATSRSQPRPRVVAAHADGDATALAYWRGGARGDALDGRRSRHATLRRRSRFPATLLAAVYAHARAAFPAECCGYLTGPRDRPSVDGAVICDNAQASGEHPTAPERAANAGFVIAGAELFAFARSFDGGRPGARRLPLAHQRPRVLLGRRPRGRRTGGPAYPVQHLVVGVTSETHHRGRAVRVVRRRARATSRSRAGALP